MANASFPVDLWNPGQVLACLGFLEAAEHLLGAAEARFNWTEQDSSYFELHTSGSIHPVEAVLDFLTKAKVSYQAPAGFTLQPDEDADDEDDGSQEDAPETVEVFPSRRAEKMALPITLSNTGTSISLYHWADGARRDNFKLYAGNRSAYSIARAMLEGVRKAPKKGQSFGDLVSKGVSQLWADDRERIRHNPFSAITPMKGSFNFDPRGAWTAIDAGYSPNNHGDPVMASPLVEIMAAWGLQNTRPMEISTRRYRYCTWGLPLNPLLARVAIWGGLEVIPQRRFQFDLALSGKNKVVNYAEEIN